MDWVRLLEEVDKGDGDALEELHTELQRRGIGKGYLAQLFKVTPSGKGMVI